MGYPNDTKTEGRNVALIILGTIAGSIGLVALCDLINTLIYG